MSLSKFVFKLIVHSFIVILFSIIIIIMNQFKQMYCVFFHFI